MVMCNHLSSDTWLRASDKVIEGLDGVFKLVDDLLIGGWDYIHLAERVEALLNRCQSAGMTRASNRFRWAAESALQDTSYMATLSTPTL